MRCRNLGKERGYLRGLSWTQGVRERGRQGKDGEESVCERASRGQKGEARQDNGREREGTSQHCYETVAQSPRQPFSAAPQLTRARTLLSARRRGLFGLYNRAAVVPEGVRLPSPAAACQRRPWPRGEPRHASWWAAVPSAAVLWHTSALPPLPFSPLLLCLCPFFPLFLSLIPTVLLVAPLSSPLIPHVSRQSFCAQSCRPAGCSSKSTVKRPWTLCRTW